MSEVVPESVMPPAGRAERHLTIDLIRVLSLGILAVGMIRLAWISDDSLITLRTALNATHGWGWGFNGTEDVQAYTHPLWFMVWSGLGATTGEWILTVILASVVFSSIAVAVIMWSATTAAAVVLAAGALALSNAFMEYSTSGLENPLAFALVALLFAVSLRNCGWASTWAPPTCFGALVAALLLTRLDLSLLVAPVVLGYVWSSRRQPKVLATAAVAGFVPLAAWFLWSRATYGSLLPNTFDAKRNVDIPLDELVAQGLRYLWISAQWDPVTPFLLMVGVVCAILGGSAVHRRWALGLVVYVGYVVFIGGDFMAGRFLAVGVVVAVLLIVTLPRWGSPGSRMHRPRRPGVRGLSPVLGLATVLAVGLTLSIAGRPASAVAALEAPRWEWRSSSGIADERGIYLARGRGLLQWWTTLGAPTGVPPYQDPALLNTKAPLADVRAAANAWPDASDVGSPNRPRAVAVRCGLLGSAAILTGPEVHWIDACALADRFLAEQPFVAAGSAWRIGHFRRIVPEGYVEAVQAGDPSLLVDAADARRLAELWETIR